MMKSLKTAFLPEKSLLLRFAFTVLFFCALFLVSGEAQAMDVAGVSVPEEVSFESADSELVLNGAGVRRKLFVKVYVGALYLPDRHHDVEAILGMPGAKRLMMHFLYKEIDAERIIKAWDKGLAANNPEETLDSLRARIAPLYRLFRDVRNGDVIRLDYLPGEGTQVWFNDDLLCTIQGEDFYRALLRTWLGSRAADAGLKKALLGVS